MMKHDVKKLPAALMQSNDRIDDRPAPRVQFNFQLNPWKTARFLGLIALLLAFLSVLGHAGEFILGKGSLEEYVRLFNLGAESNIPTWYTSVLLLLSAALPAYIASELGKSAGAAADVRWKILAGIFLYLSVDSAAIIHDITLEKPLLEAWHTDGLLYFPWVIVGWIFLAVFGLVFFNFWRGLPDPTRPLLAAAGILYVSGGLVLEMVSGYLLEYQPSSLLLRGTVATLQETAELLGLVFFIYALLDFLQRRQARQRPPDRRQA